jgi:hypothetical protein
MEMIRNVCGGEAEPFGVDLAPLKLVGRDIAQPLLGSVGSMIWAAGRHFLGAQPDGHETEKGNKGRILRARINDQPP